MSDFKRPIFATLLRRLTEPRRFIQVLSGPRQAGKTTLARQVAAALGCPVHYASADAPTLQDRVWLDQQWEIGRIRAREGHPAGALLVLDEIQKITSWSDQVKLLWDEDTQRHVPLRVVLLGSAPLLLSRGLAESLAGRFEVLPVTHWSFAEMHAAFGLDLDSYCFYGGYPGAAALIAEPERWARYIVDSLIETTLSRDILLLARVDKPALLRRLLFLACAYSGQVVSYQKMLGQLQDVGNSTTLAHYLQLLSGAGLVTGLAKFAGQRIQQRGSSPKLQVLNTAFLSAHSGLTLVEARSDGDFWGRLVESTVGAHLYNSAAGTRFEVFYWREANKEVDFVLQAGKRVVGIEVKSTLRKGNVPGLAAFDRAYKPDRKLLVGGQGIPLEEFLRAPLEQWVS